MIERYEPDPYRNCLRSEPTPKYLSEPEPYPATKAERRDDKRWSRKASKPRRIKLQSAPPKAPNPTCPNCLGFGEARTRAIQRRDGSTYLERVPDPREANGLGFPCFLCWPTTKPTP